VRSPLSPADRQTLEWLLAEKARREAEAERLAQKVIDLGSFGDWLPKASPTFYWNWRHQEIIKAQVERVIEGEIDRLMLSVPPRHGKSELVTVRLPAYLLERDPDFRAIVGAYNQTLAEKFSRKTRRICQERHVPLSKERRASNDWETQTRSPVPGGLRAAGVGVGVTGMGAIFIDDPVKNRAEANSETYRENTYEWYKDDLYTRAEPGAFMILIMTRWHMVDLAGRILQEEGSAEEGGEWTVINLPAVAGDHDILGRQPGEALCPERYDEAALARIKKVLGDSFYALYQGRPTAEEGNILKRQWFRYYGSAPARNITLEIVQSWDTASSEKELAAYSVCTTWVVTRLAYYLVDVYRERLDYPSLKRAAINQAEKWHPHAVLIENKSSGMALIQDLKSDSLVPIIAIEPEKDKITRLAVEAVAYEAGRVMHPQRAPWLVDFEAELTGAPYAEYMDQCDSTSQFLGWARRRAFVNHWASSGKLAAEQYDDGERAIEPKKGWGAVAGGNDFNGWD